LFVVKQVEILQKGCHEGRSGILAGWLLAIGGWRLAVGCWLLAISCWLF